MRTHRFTLTELLVVIAIIAILSGLILPVMGVAQARAKNTQCISNMKSVSGLLIGFSNEGQNKGRLPAELGTYPAQSKSEDKEERTWMEELTYRGIAPAGGAISQSTAILPPAQQKIALAEFFLCPSDGGSVAVHNASSYALNHYYSAQKLGTNAPATPVAFNTLNTLKSPSSTALLFENRIDWVAEPDLRDMKRYFSIIASADYLGFKDSIDTGDDPLTLMTRHRGSTNVAYADGRVDSLTRAELYGFYLGSLEDETVESKKSSTQKLAEAFFGVTTDVIKDANGSRNKFTAFPPQVRTDR